MFLFLQNSGKSLSMTVVKIRIVRKLRSNNLVHRKKTKYEILHLRLDYLNQTKINRHQKC